MNIATKTQKKFIQRVLKIENMVKGKLWLRVDSSTGRWLMATREEAWTGFYMHGNTVKSLTDKDILVNENYYNKHSSSYLTGMALSNQFR